MNGLYRNLDISTKAQMRRQNEKAKLHRKTLRGTGMIRIDRFLRSILRIAA